MKALKGKDNTKDTPQTKEKIDGIAFVRIFALSEKNFVAEFLDDNGKLVRSKVMSTITFNLKPTK